MKIGLLLIGAAILLASYFLVPGLNTSIYVTYVGYGLGGILVLAGLLGKKRF
jgi:hypothetical protein